ncbi:MAG: hypothetical protein EBE86_015290 [Hormoscilla sp. GUM202]|nr:hypothetical protein [Hormoscilla sp. GUM202]
MRQPNFRIWNQQGTSFKHVYFYSDWFEIAKPEAKGDETAQMFNRCLERTASFRTRVRGRRRRQAVFGKKFQAQLGEMTVILIGCGRVWRVVRIARPPDTEAEAQFLPRCWGV